LPPGLLRSSAMLDFYLLLGLYAVVGTGVSVVVMRKNAGQSEYFVGGGAIGWTVSAMTYAATTYSAFMMVGLVGLSYASGVGALIFELVYLVATVILLSVYGGRIWDLSREHSLVSPMELFRIRYGSHTAAAAAVVAAIALIPYTAVQVIGLAVILEGYGISYPAGVAFAAVVIGTWTLLGGLRGVAITDALQGVFMLAVAVGALIWAGSEFQGFHLSRFPNAVWTPAFFVNLTLPWMFFALTNPQVLQRLFILKRRSDLRKMVILFAIFGLVFTLIVTAVGFAAQHGTLNGTFPAPDGRDQVIVALLARMGRALALPLALSIVFASVSTANSILLTLASVVSRDVIQRRGSALIGRAVVVVLTVVVAFFALTRPTALVELSVASSRILMVFLPLLYGVLHHKTGGPVVGLVTIIGGFAATLLFSSIVPAHSSILTLVSVTGIFVAARALTGRRSITGE
jgi:SSS family solute:Na+ symporter